ncbi:endo-1,4-beta-xylanase [Rhodocaloribacter litoris]|uniref:endo-1,4-beta-xylanase n=1 Tax=Rhodocaloribacter litoris TaxID=2558931 RepID=UPI0014229683|nr:endo-1,4-beta-xylanase [Rhodocaloribacter litoris]QXD14032.1 endo-1,4-beta-xylanase [Rhodocaloribacter litoris]
MKRLRRLGWLVLAGLLCLPAYGQAWREEALARIEQYRKGTLRVRVLDTEGRPVPGAGVHARMIRHAFGFGTAVNFGLVMGSGYNPTYRALLEDLTGDGRSFNRATPENALKWPSWESEWPISNRRKIDVINWLRAKGYDIRGHTLLWPDWQWLPGDLEDNRNDPAYIRDRIREHVFALAEHRDIRGKLAAWDVVNEPAHLTALRDVFQSWPDYEVGEDLYTEVFNWAREADSTARLFVNEYNIINNYANEQSTRNYYKAIINRLLARGAPLGGIGIQGHLSAPLPSMTQVEAALDEMAVFGLPLAITEYDVRGVSEEAEAAYLEDFLTLIFSHPAVESFVMWGFWDGAHWRDNAPLFRTDWSLKPSGEVFLDLVFDRWWTDTTGVTDAEGVWEMRGFLGDYDLEVQAGEATGATTFRLASHDDTTVVEIVLPRVLSRERGAETPDRWMHVEAVAPNPFRDGTWLRYRLERPATVSLAVYDLLGRRVYALHADRPAGRHQVRIDGARWPAGLYLYHLQAGTERITGRLVKTH